MRKKQPSFFFCSVQIHCTFPEFSFQYLNIFIKLWNFREKTKFKLYLCNQQKKKKKKENLKIAKLF